MDVASVNKPLDESGIGGQLLQRMGWKSGEGLGKTGTGIVAPITAVGKVAGDTAGLGGSATVTAGKESSTSTQRERLHHLVRIMRDSLRYMDSYMD